jgi:hypothetical protein
MNDAPLVEGNPTPRIRTGACELTMRKVTGAGQMLV